MLPPDGRWRPEQRRLCGNTSGWRTAWGIRQVRLGGNGGGRDRGAPWKPVALKEWGAAELFCRDEKGRNEVGSRRVR